jgi:uncharacterized DUF497 family protein
VEFDWDDANVDHIAEHDIDPEEAEEAFGDPRRKTADARNTATERRGAIIGRTGDGRLLFVVFTIRYGRVRVVTARDATEGEQRRYRRK